MVIDFGTTTANFGFTGYPYCFDSSKVPTNSNFTRLVTPAPKVTAFAGWKVCVCIKTQDSNPIFGLIRNVIDIAHLVKSDRWTY